jgi:heterodisulfide reductase subunit B
VGFERIESQVTRPLRHVRAAAYYGCMVLRPEKEVAYENPENPQALDGLLNALGAQVIDYPHKTECCGSYLSVVSPGTALGMSYTVLASAAKNGADLLVTNCPLCQFNLDRQQAHLAQQRPGYRPMPVFYFSQLLGLALGLPTDDYGWHAHHVDPRPILERLEG